MKVHVEVTPEDIANGKPDNADSCPIALALKRAVPGREPWVGKSVAMIRGGTEAGVELPEVAVDFIQRFDQEDEDGNFYAGVVEPIAFDLEFPE